jgi:hypothetical protein
VPPGTHSLVVYAHSTVTGTFNQSRSIQVTIHQGSVTRRVGTCADDKHLAETLGNRCSAHDHEGLPAGLSLFR